MTRDYFKEQVEHEQLLEEDYQRAIHELNELDAEYVKEVIEHIDVNDLLELITDEYKLSDNIKGFNSKYTIEINIKEK